MMSEKKVKPTRKEKIAIGEQVLFQVVVTVQRNGQVSVAGFPASVSDALMLIGDINKAMMLHFVKHAREGNMDQNGVLKQSNIIMPKGVPHHAISRILKPETPVVKKKPGEIVEIPNDIDMSKSQDEILKEVGKK